MTTTHLLDWTGTLARMERAVQKVIDRLALATTTLERSEIPYAVTGGNAVALWVGTVDEGAVRNTRDVDILIRRGDLLRVIGALTGSGMVYRESDGVKVFPDAAQASIRDSVHIVFAGEKVRQNKAILSPQVEESVYIEGIRVQSLQALVRIKLAIWRTVDRVHVPDLLDVGLIDETWVERLPPELGKRLQQSIETNPGWR